MEKRKLTDEEFEQLNGISREEWEIFDKKRTKIQQMVMKTFGHLQNNRE